ncbi:uncharacterized protein LOC106174329 isoform X2 [Lingula anatina]|uniref:Uncharacterized protein LOC106174329 isoform X2 n=1 Tax=Lingula anatina TaxID=7574 RepID=A0A1S3JLP4_LINAN|nr:uncharacterized protein LOC106174329 isoform X2 [Lingula anatina]|eukprot:XP_013411303.1 uncharacterized protein LOC106174329 isoform X2 [Lingula anatina]
MYSNMSMDFRIMSTVMLYLLFVLLGITLAEDISSDDPEDRVRREAELEYLYSLPNDDAEILVRVEKDVAVVGAVIAGGNLILGFINTILKNVPDPITRTCVVSIRNFLDTKALVNPVVYPTASNMKGIPPERIGPEEATVLEFDQAGKDEKPEGSFVYNIEGTDLYVTVLFHVVPPNTYNARIFTYDVEYSDVKEYLHQSMKTVADFYPLVAHDTIQYDIRQECGYKVSVIMNDHERATMQVDVYDCPDTIDKTVLVVTNQTTNETIIDPLGCEPGDLPNCGCCHNISGNYTDSLSSSNANSNSLSIEQILAIALSQLVAVLLVRR